MDKYIQNIIRTQKYSLELLKDTVINNCLDELETDFCDYEIEFANCIAIISGKVYSTYTECEEPDEPQLISRSADFDDITIYYNNQDFSFSELKSFSGQFKM